MCNRVHKGKTFRKIPKSGKGYKLFHRTEHGQLVSLIHRTEHGQLVSLSTGHQDYKSKKDGWVKFNHKLAKTRLIDHGIAGFCFFPTKRTARMALERWMYGPNKTQLKSQNSFSSAFTNTVLREIEYREGLGSHIEKEFMVGCRYRIAICQEFRPILKEGDML